MVFLDASGVDALLFLEFESGAEEILEGAPLVAIKIVHKTDELRFVEAVIAEELAYMCPVFLLDVSAIVFMVGAGTGELSGRRPVSQIPVQMVIKEFGAIIAIEAKDGKRQRCFNVLDLCHDSKCTLVPGGAVLGPAGEDIGQGQAPDKVTCQAIAAVRHGIGFHKTGPGNIPMPGANANLVLEQRARAWCRKDHA